MDRTSRFILADADGPIAPACVDPAHGARERSERALCPVPTDDSLAVHTRMLRAFLAAAGARRRARRHDHPPKRTQATETVACVSFRHGPCGAP
jgi:hypothetical protein